MSDIRYKITADSKGAVTSVKKLDKQIDKMPSTAKKAQAGIKNLWLQVGAGIAVAQGVIRGLKGLINFMGDTIEKAKEQEQAEIAMEAALKTTGREIQQNSKHYKKYASSIQKVTMFGDEEILQSQALLLQLTNLRQDGIDKATEAAVGLATVYDQDLSAATVLVGKALAGNFGALSRYGIQVDKNLSASEKQASLLEQLSVMYGRAKEETLSFAGIQKQMTNLWGDMQEQLGEAVTESEELRMNMYLFKETMQAIVESGIISDFAKALGKISNSIPWIRQLQGSLAFISTELIEMAIAEKEAREAREEAIPNMEAIASYAKTYGLNLQFAVDWLKQLTEKEDEGAGAANEFYYTIKSLNTEVDELSSNMDELVDAVYPAKDVFDDGSEAIEGFGQAGQASMQMVVDKVLESNPVLQAEMVKTVTSAKIQLQQFAELAKELWSDIANFAYHAVTGIDNVFRQLNENEMIRIDNEREQRESAIESWYEQQRQRILDNIKDEEKRTEALKKLEEEKTRREEALQDRIEEKTKEAERKAAKRDKAVALMQAIVHTASAVVEALPNIPLSILVGALGAAQIAAIASQPIPLAQGGILERPTYLMGEAGREAVIPLESARGKELIRETFKSTNTPIYLTIQNKIDENWFKKKVTKIVEDQTRLGNLKIASKAVQ